MQPLLSLVVPIYEVGHYLDACLESISVQALEDIEVVIVDDGSTDESRSIAEEWAEKDERMIIVSQLNRGLSEARNTGIDVASGKYLAFCDGDDRVPPRAYAELVGSLERSGSDMASGDVRQFRSDFVRPYAGYRDAFSEALVGVSVRARPVLLRDRMVWNKVFRRSFWDATGLKFVLTEYEDAPVMLRAHLAARAVDVLTDVVYLWRIREDGPLSITQRVRDPANVAACMVMIGAAYDVILELAPELGRPYVEEMCGGDLWLIHYRLQSHPVSDLASAVQSAIDFVRRIPLETVRALPLPDRRLVENLAIGDLEAVRTLSRS